MTEAASLGAARIDVEVDVTNLEAAVRTAKNRLADMSTDAQKQYSQLNQAEKRRVDNLISQADQLGLTRSQQLAYNAALKTSGPVLDELTRKIAQNEAKLRGGATQLGLYGKSAKETAFAMRNLPAQLTDIFVGLSTGQRPLMVLLQQGGQLKDLFGGIVPAAKALGSSLLGLVNPYTLAATAAAGLAYVYYKGSQESYEFNKAIILSGNAAGVTAEGLSAMADRIDAVVSTRTNAAKVLAQLAATGQVSADGLENAAKAALRLESVGGPALEETIRNLVALGERPTEASRKLNQQYSYLNASTLDRIRLLEKEGHVAEAAALAQQEFTAAGLQRATDLEKHLSGLPALAQSAKKGIAEMWDAILHFDRPKTGEDQLKELDMRIEGARRRLANPGFLDGINGAPARAQQVLDESQAEKNRLDPNQLLRADQAQKRAAQRIEDEKAAGMAMEQWDKLAESNLSKRAKLEKEIVDIRRLGLAARKTEAEIDVQIAAARAKAVEGKQPKVNSDDNSAKSLVESIERQVEANNELAFTGKKNTASESIAIRVRQVLADKTNTMTDATRTLLQVMLPQLTASDKAAASAQAEAKAKEALTRQNAILAQQSQNRRDSNDVALQSSGRGQDAIEQLQRRIAINREYETELRRLGDRSVADDKVTWDKLADNAKTQRDQMLREEKEFQRQRAILMGDPVRGAQAAWENYLDSSRNVASQTEALLTDAFHGAEDALVKFVRTGKVSFKDLANSIIADLARIAAKKAITGIVGSLFGTPKANAMGGIYQSPGLSAYSGQVVSQPTMFAFAKGAGLMGEAGPEAILPLKRTQGGQLGVASSGGGDLQVQVNNYAGAKVATREEKTRGPDGQALRRLIVDIVADDMASGGSTARAAQGRFALQPAVG